MIPIPNTTLCCIDCLNHQAAIRALQLSQTECQFEKVLFLTDIEFELDDIDVKLISPINSSEQYSHFVIKQLINYVDTNYIILVQWDGYIINGSAWDDKFFKYDYIGARWPDAKSSEQVGNGGFSLRSRKLLAALQDERAVSKGPEDEDICKHFRDWLMRDYNIQFSPLEIADYFSYERAQPVHLTLGFHGVFNMYKYIKNSEWQYFLENLSAKTFKNIEMLELAINAWRHGKIQYGKNIMEKIIFHSPGQVNIEYLLNEISKFEGNLPGENIRLPDSDDILKYGLIKQTDGELEDAWKLYTLAALIAPENAEAKNLMGIFSVEVGQMELAINYFRNAIALNNGIAGYYENLVYTCIDIGKTDDAIECLQLAIDEFPDNENFHRNLAQLYERKI